MSDDVVLDGSLFFRARRASRLPPPSAYRVLLLDPAVSVCALLHALRHTDLVVSDDPTTGNQILHRRPGPKPAA